MRAHSKQISLLQHLSLLKSTLFISTFGTYISLTLTLSPTLQSAALSNPPPRPHIFTSSTAQTFIAVAFLLFLLALCLSGLALALLIIGGSVAWGKDLEEKAAKGKRRKEEEHWVTKYAPFITGTVFYTLTCAFLFCALAVTAFAPVPGILAVVLLLLFVIGSLFLWINVAL
jgi:hypothetical protein